MENTNSDEIFFQKYGLKMFILLMMPFLTSIIPYFFSDFIGAILENYPLRLFNLEVFIIVTNLFSFLIPLGIFSNWMNDRNLQFTFNVVKVISPILCCIIILFMLYFIEGGFMNLLNGINENITTIMAIAIATTMLMILAHSFKQKSMRTYALPNKLVTLDIKENIFYFGLSISILFGGIAIPILNFISLHNHIIGTLQYIVGKYYVLIYQNDFDYNIISGYIVNDTFILYSTIIMVSIMVSNFAMFYVILNMKTVTRWKTSLKNILGFGTLIFNILQGIILLITSTNNAITNFEIENNILFNIQIPFSIYIYSLIMFLFMWLYLDTNINSRTEVMSKEQRYLVLEIDKKLYIVISKYKDEKWILIPCEINQCQIYFYRGEYLIEDLTGIEMKEIISKSAISKKRSQFLQ